jgi:hypothetical protein
MAVVAQVRDWRFSRRMALDRATERAFFGVSALLFAASAAVTIVWCPSMSAMGEMPMPGGWTMSMAWMRGGVVSDRMSSRARMTHPAWCADVAAARGGVAARV